MSYSRHAERQKYSGDDYSRSARSSYSSKRSEDKVKGRKERDRDYDRRKERRRSAERSSDKKSTPKEQDSRSKISRSRSKVDRTYNTDTEESDESSESPGRVVKQRQSSDHDEDKPRSDDEKRASNHPRARKDNEDLKGKNTRKNKDSERSPKTGSRGNLPFGPALPQHKESKSIGPVLPPNFKRKDSPDESKLVCLVSNPQKDSKSIGTALSPRPREVSPRTPHRSEDESNIVGPVLPQHLERKGSPTSSPRTSEKDVAPAQIPDNCGSIGPVVFTHLRKSDSSDSEGEFKSIGPVLPQHFQKRASESTSIGPALPSHLRGQGVSNNESKSIGPALPPKADDDDFVGPALPPGLKQTCSRTLGPSLPPEMERPEEDNSEESDEEVIGPMLPEQLIQSNKNYLVHTQLERRAAEVKRKMEQKDGGPEVTKREQWMLELPPEGTVDLGLGPRTFRVKGAPEKGADRSMWTDTPADKLRKQEQAMKDENEGTSSKAELPPEISLRDKEMEKVVKKHSKKRGKESLLDLHQKELNKKKKKDKDDGKKEERRPFSREVDLKTNVFDEAQKKSIFKKAQLLDTRFSRGETKYL